MTALKGLLAPMPLTPRMAELIQATEDSLADYETPLSHSFLCDHDVTLDEAYALSDHMALALKAYRRAPAATLMTAAVEAMIEDEKVES